MFTSPRTSRLTALLSTVVLASSLAACSGTPSASDDGIVVTDAWVKSVDEGMTAAFGVLTNTTDADVTLVAASTDASPMVELHETLTDADGSSMMQEVDGGLTISAGDSLTLEPGGNHLMLMGITEPLIAGDDVTLTLEWSDGSTQEIVAVVKDYSGAQEEYSHDVDGMDGES